MQIDWKDTWRWNLAVDFYQTCHFASRGIEEVNPLWRGFVERKDYLGLAASWIAAGALAEQVADRNPRLYVWLSAVQLLVVSANAKNHKIGFPVLIIRF